MKKSAILTALAMVMIVAVSLMTVSCGGSGDPTLESYIAENEDAMEEINEAAGESGVEVSITGNDLTYTYSFDLEMDEETTELVKEQLESAMESYTSTFESLAADLEEESGVSGITIIVIYQDTNGNELFNGQYVAG